MVGAHIQLGRCLDLADTRYTDLLVEAYREVQDFYRETGRSLPTNQNKRNTLDCLVINTLLKLRRFGQFQTVRCPFLEGDPAFEGSKIRRQSHIQISVIDPSCIVGVFRPNLD